jgi:hypothetical protein
MQHVENDLDVTIEKLSSTNVKLDEKDKAFQVYREYSNYVEAMKNPDGVT